MCSSDLPSFVIPMLYDAIEGNAGDPGHFTSLAHRNGGSATVVVPPRARPVTLALP